MRHFRKILLFVAVIFSLILSVTVYVYLERQAAVKPDQQATKIVLIALVDIPARTPIVASMFEEIAVPDNPIFEGALTKPDEVVGKYTKIDLFKGDPFKATRLMESLKDDISLNLTETFRAMSINVTQASGVSDLIKVGDSVDIVVWLPEIKEAQRVIRPNIAKIVMQHVEVLSVNRVRERSETYTVELVPSYTLTLAVPVFEVERFVLAQSVGTIQVALRPYDSNTLFQTPGVIWEDLLVDDFGRMKDLFPQYEIEGTKTQETSPIAIEKYTYYTVVYGDSLRKIAAQFYNDESKYILIKEVNQIQDENIIFPGMALKIPVIEEKVR